MHAMGCSNYCIIKPSLFFHIIIIIMHLFFTQLECLQQQDNAYINPHSRRLLSALNKPAITTIQSVDGDIIDCINITHQPAFDHPLLKNHRIKEPPSGIGRPRPSNSINSSSERFKGVSQVWREAGNCPSGTIPVRRTGIQDINRAPSVNRFGRKSTASLHSRFNQTLKPRAVVRRNELSGNHDHAIAYVSSRNKIFGAKAIINVWEPKVAEADEFSLSQLWILSGSFIGELNTIEAGWQVSPELYGDSRPRFFIYWTADAYQKTGCYNLLCSGFVQTSNAIAMGASVYPVSSFQGPQYDIRILIWKDPVKGDWWLELDDNIVVGYWPSVIFSHLGRGANIVEWGGEVVNSGARGHTSTQMGSGHFAQEGFSHASYFRNLQFVDDHNNLRPVSSDSQLKTATDEPHCYDIQLNFNANWGTYFYYGGPGKSLHCP